MDKETLSNYGWIVICTLVLAVMIALAGPFGKFVADAVKSTTQGLFDVNQNALDSADIEITQQKFEDMLNDSSNASPAPVVYELSGKWVFNETLNQGTNPNTTVSVNYTTDGDSYIYMDVYDGMIFYSNSGANAFISYNEGWMDDAYKIVDFGTSSQTVTKAFYDWFTANATKQ